MHVCGQTLVLVDNDATVSEVNQKLVKTTLKYLFYHMPEDRTFCLRTYEHDISSDEEFLSDANDLVCLADKLEFEPKDSNITDTVAEVITRWKSSDFACRDILIFTDGLEGAATDHEEEELYYLIENSEYPVYVVMLDQENNAEAKKGLSAMAVTSGGKFFETEFEGSDAEVDKQLTEKIFAAMDEYAQVHWAKYEETEEAEEAAGEVENGEAGSDVLEEDVPNDLYELPGSEEGVIYEYDKTPGFFESPGAFILSALLIVIGLTVGILGGFLLMKKNRKSRVVPEPVDEDDYFEDYDLKGIDTVYLGDADDSGSPTRLLTEAGRLITLTDSVNGNVFRIMLKGSMTVGRGECDVVITGDDALSKRHCEIYEKDGMVCVRDLASSNGTRVNNVKITEKALSDNDELTIGARSYKVGFA